MFIRGKRSKAWGSGLYLKFSIQRRVWSWLRMNASGRLNTCKSRGISSNTERPAHGWVTRMQPALYRRIARWKAD